MSRSRSRTRHPHISTLLERVALKCRKAIDLLPELTAYGLVDVVPHTRVVFANVLDVLLRNKRCVNWMSPATRKCTLCAVDDRIRVLEQQEVLSKFCGMLSRLPSRSRQTPFAAELQHGVHHSHVIIYCHRSSKYMLTAFFVSSVDSGRGHQCPGRRDAEGGPPGQNPGGTGDDGARQP